jgi:hypothetical protein
MISSALPGKAHVAEIIQLRVAAGIGNRFADDLNAVDMPRFLRKKERNRSDAAIGIYDDLIAG